MAKSSRQYRHISIADGERRHQKINSGELIIAVAHQQKYQQKNSRAKAYL